MPLDPHGEGPSGDWLQELEEFVEHDERLEIYPELARRDPRIAELYRQALTEPERLDPVLAYVDEDGQVWIDIFVRAKEGVEPESLQGFMEVRTDVGGVAVGRVPAQNLPELLRVTERLQAPRPLGPSLERTIETIFADPVSLGGPDNAPDGSGVIVGIIDVEGFDLKHPNFRDEDGRSRVLCLWDQNAREGPHPANYDYGREYTRDVINDALGDEDVDPYIALDYTPEDKAHATHVADIAAGSSPQYPGVAPGATLIFVDLGGASPEELEASPLAREAGSLGSTARLTDAVKYIFEKADEREKPAVINISLGSNGGPHDGSTLVEETLDRFLTEPNQAGRAVVIAAGNSYSDGIHTAGTVPVGGSRTIEWLVETNAVVGWQRRQEMEIWYDASGELEMEIETPTGQSLGVSALGDDVSTPVTGTNTPALIIHHGKPEREEGDADENRINIFLDDRRPQLPFGKWRFHLRHAGGGDISFHAWIERNDAYPSHFAPAQSDPATSINAIANARWPLVVAAYNADDEAFPIAGFSSAGPSRNPHAPDKPDLSAPGINIYAARASHNGGTVKSGTSMAAPLVTGVIALLFQAGREQLEGPLNMDKIRDLLLSTADQDPPGGAPDTRYGAGRVNAADALNALQGL